MKGVFRAKSQFGNNQADPLREAGPGLAAGGEGGAGGGAGANSPLAGTGAPDELGGLSQKVYQAARLGRHLPQTGLDISQVGRRCPRAIWLYLHQAPRAEVEGRRARVLAEVARREEVIVAELAAAGYQVVDRGQKFSALEGRLTGYGCGVILGLKNYGRALLEIKSVPEAAFKIWARLGLAAWPGWFFQMQAALYFSGLPKGVLLVENKNTLELHARAVTFKPAIWRGLEAYLGSILAAPEAPAPGVAAGQECGWCDFRGLSCQESGESKEEVGT